MALPRKLLYSSVVFSMLGGIPLLLAAGGEHEVQSPPLANLLDEIQRGERLRQNARACSHSMATTEALLAEVLEGRLSLDGAALARRIEEESQPSSLRPSPRPHPQLSTEDYYVQWVFGQVEVRLRRDSRRLEILSRLRAELLASRIPPALSRMCW
jgi:hypothetical protein